MHTPDSLSTRGAGSDRQGAVADKTSQDLSAEQSLTVYGVGTWGTQSSVWLSPCAEETNGNVPSTLPTASLVGPFPFRSLGAGIQVEVGSRVPQGTWRVHFRDQSGSHGKWTNYGPLFALLRSDGNQVQVEYFLRFSDRLYWFGVAINHHDHTSEALAPDLAAESGDPPTRGDVVATVNGSDALLRRVCGEDAVPDELVSRRVAAPRMVIAVHGGGVQRTGTLVPSALHAAIVPPFTSWPPKDEDLRRTYAAVMGAMRALPIAP